MILHAEGRMTRVSQPFDRVVVEVRVGDLDVVRQRLRVDREPVVLARYLDLFPSRAAGPDGWRPGAPNLSLKVVPPIASAST